MAMEISVYGILAGMGKFLFLLFAVVALAQRPWPPPGMRCPERTLVLFEVVPANASKAGQFYNEHIAWLTAQMKAGKVVTGGPTADGRGVMVFAGKDWAEVEAALKNEPFGREGINKISSHTVWTACELEK
jgi:uncharacterized protein